jgi:hypothetical protein
MSDLFDSVEEDLVVYQFHFLETSCCSKSRFMVVAAIFSTSLTTRRVVDRLRTWLIFADIAESIPSGKVCGYPKIFLHGQPQTWGSGVVNPSSS